MAHGLEPQRMLSDPQVRTLLQRRIAEKSVAASSQENHYPVEFCTREADIPGKSIHHAQHWWLRTPDFEAGMGPRGGGIPGHGGVDSPFVTQTAINDHSGQGKAADATCVPAGQVDWRWANEDRDCLMRVMQIGRDTGRWRPTNQCHTVVVEALESCRIPALGEELSGGDVPDGGISVDGEVGASQ